MQLNSRSLLLSIVALARFAACAPATSEPATALGAAQNVAIEVHPNTATLGVGGTAQFAAVVTGTVNTAVTWQVTETSGGNVSASGLYTAPAAAGTYHVVAVSAADGTRTATATVTVQPAAPVVVSISPASATVAAGGTRTFTAAVTGAANTAVAWSVREAGCGSVTAAGVYTAPASAATCHVVATSSADGVTTGVATVTVTAPTAVVVAIGPASPAVDACRTLTFTATVTGTTNTAVDWSVQEGATGGTITSAGVYTAPDTGGTYHVVATSRAAPASSSSIGVVVTERVLSVAITPPTVAVQPNGTAQFTATVTTTCGSVTQKQTVALAQ